MTTPSAGAGVVIPVLNQVEYTIGCLDGLRRHGEGVSRVVVVDNGSTDGTAEEMSRRPDVTVLRNPENLGCAAAWNQGVRAVGTEWIAILNNDVILTSGWLPGLLDFAEEEGADIVSPAIREGAKEYDVEEYAREFVRRMGGVARRGGADGICFLVRRRVFDTIGFFDENFRVGQFEDVDFFRRAREAGFRLATTGRSFIHHFGSITQDSLRQNRATRPYEAENREYYREKWGLTRGGRLLERVRRKSREFVWRWSERLLHGHTLKERWVGGRLLHG
jgi:N-acetylglucosaminyl-diphospho-decaprenol L-rhamnosyltransferase